MLTSTLTDKAQLCPERRNASRLRQDATIAVRHGRKGFRSFTLIESTRHGARLVMPGNVKKEDSVHFVVSIGSQSFQGEARIAWTMPLSNGQAVVGLEFLSFALVQTAA